MERAPIEKTRRGAKVLRNALISHLDLSSLQIYSCSAYGHTFTLSFRNKDHFTSIGASPEIFGSCLFILAVYFMIEQFAREWNALREIGFTSSVFLELKLEQDDLPYVYLFMIR